MDAVEDSQHNIDALEETGEGEAEITKDEVAEIKEEKLEEEEGVLKGVKEIPKKKENDRTFSEYNKYISTQPAVRDQKRGHKQPKIYLCEKCCKSFSSKYNLKAHIKTHEDRDRPHSCDVCRKTFYTKYELNNHLKSHEGPKNVCQLCGKSLATAQTLELHLLTHTGEKPYPCEICGTAFRQRSNKDAHIKATHCHEKKHTCQLCQKSFLRKRALDYHMNSVHTGVRPFKCEVCSATFAYPQHFKRHIKKHTDNRLHKCEICKKTFASSENRNAHMFIHSDKKPYECKVCCAGFMRKPLCIAHLAVHGQIDGYPEAFITLNSPSVLVTKHDVSTAKEEKDEVVKSTEEATSKQSIKEDQTDTMKCGNGVKVTSEPVQITIYPDIKVLQ